MRVFIKLQRDERSTSAGFEPANLGSQSEDIAPRPLRVTINIDSHILSQDLVPEGNIIFLSSVKLPLLLTKDLQPSVL